MLGLAWAAGCSGGGGTSAGLQDRPTFDQIAPPNSNPANAAPAPGAQAAAVVTPSPELDEPVALINKQPLTRRQLMQPLLEAHGLTMLLNLARLNLAKQDAALEHVEVSAQDFAEERKTTLDKMFADSQPEQALDKKLEEAVAKKDEGEANRLRREIETQRQEFLDQFLHERQLSPIEFDIVLQINTYLRKIAEPKLKGRITEEDIKSAFGQLYGERASVRYIELANMNEVRQAQRRLAAGDAFQDVARDMSHNRDSAMHGGEMPLFTRSAPGLPDNFKDSVFSLQEGQVSDPLTIGTSYLLVKLEKKLPPTVIKYEDVKESVRATLYEKILAAGVRQLREMLNQQVPQVVQIKDPILQKEYQALIDRQQVHDKEKIRGDIDRQRIVGNNAATAPATTQPTADPEPMSRIVLPQLPNLAQPATAPATDPDRPPATQPRAGQ